MSLNYTTLQTAILNEAKRSDLSAECPGFVRLAEGMIRREVRAHETRTTLDDTDRIAVDEGRYTLPDTIQEVRAIFAEANGVNYALNNVGLAAIRSLDGDSAVLQFAVAGGVVEFRGVPAVGAELEVQGIGWPDPLATTSTNDLLTDHEALYLYGALHFLYQHTQDLELAQAALSIYTSTKNALNAQIGRKLGGGVGLPAYNFGHVRIGRGY